MKKVICTLLALVMVMSMMVGCGSKEETTTEAPAKEETSAPAEEKKEEAPAEEKKEEAPTEWTEEGYLPFANGETLVIGTSELAVVDNYDTNPLTVWLEEQTGVNIEFMFFPGDAGAKQQTFTLMVAAGEKLPDIIMNGVELTTQMINEYGRDGYIVDLKDYIGDMNYTPYMTQS